MRVKDVAAILDISASCVYQLLKAGEIEATRPGLRRGTWGVTEEAVADYVRRRTVEKSEPPPSQELKHLRL